MRRSIPATRAARSSTSMARCSASAPRSCPARAATSGSASPFRATWSVRSLRSCSSTATCTRPDRYRHPGLTPGLRASTRAPTTRRPRHADEPGSPSEQAGIEAGDVIVAIDDEPVDSSSDLRNEVGLVRAGEAVDVDPWCATTSGARSARRSELGHGRACAGVRSRRRSGSRCRYWPAPQVMEVPSDHPAFGRVRGVLGQRRGAGLRGRTFRPEPQTTSSPASTATRSPPSPI